jgi:hypothetical protein
MDLETFSDNPVDPRLLATGELAAFLPTGARLKGKAEDVAWLLSWTTLRDSLRTLDREIATREAQEDVERKAPKPEFAADGFRRWDAHDRRAEKGRSFKDALPASVKIYENTYGNTFGALSPLARQYVERTLASMNEWGVRPVLALSPIHPQLRKHLLGLGYEERHREVVAYLESLKKRYDFVLLDMTGLGAFGGSPSAFYDGVHMKVENTRRLIDAVAAGSDGVLTADDGG